MRVNRTNSGGLDPVVAALVSKGGILLRVLRRELKPYQAKVYNFVRSIFSQNPTVNKVEIYVVELGNGRCVWATNVPTNGSYKVGRSGAFFGTDFYRETVKTRPHCRTFAGSWLCVPTLRETI